MSRLRLSRRCILCGEVERALDAVDIFTTADGLKFCAHPRCQKARELAGVTDTRESAQ